MASDENLHEAVRQALGNAIDLIRQRTGLTAEMEMR